MIPQIADMITTFMVQDGLKEYLYFFAKFDMVKPLSFINTNQRPMALQGAIWMSLNTYYWNKTKQYFPLTKMPYLA